MNLVDCGIVAGVVCACVFLGWCWRLAAAVDALDARVARLEKEPDEGW